MLQFNKPVAFTVLLESVFGSSCPSGLCLSPIGLSDSTLSQVVETISATFGISTAGHVSSD